MPSPRARALRVAARAIAITAITWFTVIFLAPAASGHALLLSSSPADRAALDALPQEVSLAFYEQISPPAYVVVRAPDGSDLAQGEASVTGSLIKQRIDASTQEGTYTLAYSAVSIDGHPISGQVLFTVGSTNTLTTGKNTAAAATTGTESGHLTVLAAEASNFLTERRDLLIGAGLFALSGLLYFLSRPRRTTRPDTSG